ncbi:MAG: hypothetical protein A2Y94_04440 [Caldithrix sp. RBG_13_44_9]|nr:MAG: hypothetical protein A2Y94_04440 [Caldithrix sp. RBG_13_44_9]
MKSKIADRVRIQHILDAIKEIQSYTAGVSFEDFRQNSMMRFASIKQLEIIGEAANNITDETKNKFPLISWNEIIGLRNILIHEYFGVDDNILWDIIRNDIPLLKKQLSEIIDQI